MTPVSGEKVFRGIAASPGIAIGRAVVLRRDEPKTTPRRIVSSQIDAEIERFQAAIKATQLLCAVTVDNVSVHRLAAAHAVSSRSAGQIGSPSQCITNNNSTNS